MSKEVKDTVIEEIKEEVAPSLAMKEGSEEVCEDRPIVLEEAIEAILFAAGHPLSYATLARVFDMTPAKVRDAVYNYAKSYNDSSIPRGVILLTYPDSCQLCTKKYYLTEIREALGIKKSGTLSTSSMEALAIVAYNQPVTRAFVDTLRRADSSYAMNNLLDRGLIEAKGRLDAPGRPMLYGTSIDFLRSFGIKDISELPKTSEEIDEMFRKAKTASDENESFTEEELPLNEGLTENEGAPLKEALENEEATKVTEDEYDSEPSAEDDLHNFYSEEDSEISG